VSDSNIAQTPVCVTSPGVVNDALHLPLPLSVHPAIFIPYTPGGAPLRL